MSVVDVGNLKVHFEVHGAGPDDLVFVHGFRNSIETWAPVRNRMDPNRYTAKFLDLPGCGQSDTPSAWTACTIDAYAELLVAFFEKTGLVRPVLVGHSLGAGIGLALALDHRESIRGLVLVAPVSTQGLEVVTDDQFAALLDPSAGGRPRRTRPDSEDPSDGRSDPSVRRADLSRRRSRPVLGGAGRLRGAVGWLVKCRPGRC